MGCNARQVQAAEDLAFAKAMEDLRSAFGERIPGSARRAAISLFVYAWIGRRHEAIEALLATARSHA